MYPGMIPILHPPPPPAPFSPGVMIPGQFGPISVTPGYPFKNCFTFTMSFTGIPSVIATITDIPASAASMIASPANAGGTNTMLAVAPVAFTASLAVSNTGNPLPSFVPPFPGLVPPTIFVPYSKHAFV